MPLERRVWDVAWLADGHIVMVGTDSSGCRRPMPPQDNGATYDADPPRPVHQMTQTTRIRVSPWGRAWHDLWRRRRPMETGRLAKFPPCPTRLDEVHFEEGQRI